MERLTYFLSDDGFVTVGAFLLILLMAYMFFRVLRSSDGESQLKTLKSKKIGMAEALLFAMSIGQALAVAYIGSMQEENPTPYLLRATLHLMIGLLPSIIAFSMGDEAKEAFASIYQVYKSPKEKKSGAIYNAIMQWVQVITIVMLLMAGHGGNLILAAIGLDQQWLLLGYNQQGTQYYGILRTWFEVDFYLGALIVETIVNYLTVLFLVFKAADRVDISEPEPEKLNYNDIDLYRYYAVNILGKKTGITPDDIDQYLEDTEGEKFKYKSLMEVAFEKAIKNREIVDDRSKTADERQIAANELNAIHVEMHDLITELINKSSSV